MKGTVSVQMYNRNGPIQYWIMEFFAQCVGEYCTSRFKLQFHKWTHQTMNQKLICLKESVVVAIEELPYSTQLEK